MTKTRNYKELFDDIISVHLHKLVTLVEGLHSHKVLVHEWVLGVEKSWRGLSRDRMVYPDYNIVYMNKNK